MNTLILLALLAGTLYALKLLHHITLSLGRERVVLLVEVQGSHKIEAIGKRICKPHDRGRHKWD